MKNNSQWPVLLLDETRVRKNVRRMVAKAKASGCHLRPHFKTHQSTQIGEWLRQEGVTSITVSSIRMAEYFADAGWTDILIAIPANILLVDAMKELSHRLDRLILLADHPDTLKALDGKVKADVVIEVDTGSQRTGVPFENIEGAKKLYQQLEDAISLSFTGFYSHAGHTYKSRGSEAVLETGGLALQRITDLRDAVDSSADIYFGDTPFASCATTLDKVNVMTPGNFVFYDAMQLEIGSCGVEDVAVCLVSPVISLHPERNELAIHGGGVHLAKDTLDDNSFGPIVTIESEGWSDPLPGYKVRTISQEHGIVSVPDGEMNKWKVGDVVGILPVHSCMTAEAMAAYRTLNNQHVGHFKKEKPA